MANKNKINQHFRSSSNKQPTTAAKLIEEGANKLGSWFLLGLGALGKVLNAGFTSPTYGTNGQVSYARNIQDANRLRKLFESLEQALAKGATYIMPANYIVGKGNPVKGEEIISLMLPWLQAFIRGSELYFGPKAVKGVKNTPKTVVNTAAKAGNKTAKKAVVAREIKLNVKNTLPKLSNRTVSVNRNINAITGKPDLTYTLYNEFGEPIGQTNIGSATMGLIEREGSRKLDRMVDGIYSKNKAHKVSEDTYNVAVLDVIDNGGTGIESGWSLMSPLKTLAVISKFPNMVIGLEFGNPVRLLTGRSSRPLPLKVLGNHYLEIKPKTEIKFNEATGEFEEVATLSIQVKEGTYPIYRGSQFSIKSVVNPDGTVNPRLAMKVLHTVADWYKLFGEGAYKMEHRLENPEWHKTDPTTYHHTKNVALSAWGMKTPKGFTKLDQMVAALGHDFGKMVSGDGHAQIGADILKQAFPDITEALYRAIAEHMGTPKTVLGKATKAADIDNGRIEYRKQGGKMNILEFLKNGSGIHIKKKNRGKFTSYCGGKVTDKCILRGKNSSNPIIRKRATFAANARKWKHKTGGSFRGYPSKAAYDVRLEEVAGFKKGGIIKADDGTKLTFGLKIGNFMNSNAGLGLLNVGMNTLQFFLTNNALSKQQEEFNKYTLNKKKSIYNVDTNAIKQQAMQELAFLKLNNPDLNFGTIDLQLKIKNILDYLIAKNKQQIDLEIAQEQYLNNMYTDAIKGLNTSNLINSFSNGLMSLLNYKSKNLATSQV